MSQRNEIQWMQVKGRVGGGWKDRNFHRRLDRSVLTKDYQYGQKVQFDINLVINKLKKIIKSLSVHGLGFQ